jgi:hypothetical protein
MARLADGERIAGSVFSNLVLQEFMLGIGHFGVRGLDPDSSAGRQVVAIIFRCVRIWSRET